MTIGRTAASSPEGLKGPHGFDPAPRFWIALDGTAGKGPPACPGTVYGEMQDGLADRGRGPQGGRACSRALARRRRPGFEKRECRGKESGRPRRRFLDRADPRAIASAIAGGGSAAARGRRNPDGPARARIPDACGNFGVRRAGVYRMPRGGGPARAGRARHESIPRRPQGYGMPVDAQGRQALRKTRPQRVRTPDPESCARVRQTPGQTAFGHAGVRDGGGAAFQSPRAAERSETGPCPGFELRRQLCPERTRALAVVRRRAKRDAPAGRNDRERIRDCRGDDELRLQAGVRRRAAGTPEYWAPSRIWAQRRKGLFGEFEQNPQHGTGARTARAVRPGDAVKGCPGYPGRKRSAARLART